MLFSKNKRFYRLLISILQVYGNDHKTEINGVYLENPQEALKVATLTTDSQQGNQAWNQGVIDNIKWECCPHITLEDVQKKFPDFVPGKYVNINEMKYILLFLKQQLNMEYDFQIKINKNKPERVTITLQEKEGDKFIITKVIVKGNRILKTDDILEAISPVLCPMTLIEKLKWLIFKKTGAIITGINIEQMVEKLTKNLGDLQLLLDLKVKVELKKNYKNKTAIAIVTVTEGSKYFIRRIVFDKNIKVDRKKLRTWLEKQGINGGNFNHLKEFFQAYNYFNLNIYHKIDGNYIDLYIGTHNAEFSQIVEMITYIGFSDVSISYIYKNLKVRINEPYNHNLMAEFLYKQSIILNATITEETSINAFNKVNVQITKSQKEEEQNFFSFKNSQFVFQYKFTKRLYEIPNLILSFTPELHMGNSSKVGFLLNATYRMKNLCKLQIFDGEILLNVNAIREGNKKHIIENVNLNFLQISNHPNVIENLRWNLSPINVATNYNALAKNENFKRYTYYYTGGNINKIHVLILGIRRIKLSNFLQAKYFFGHNFKIKINPEIRYPLTKQLHIIGSMRVLYNNKTIDINNDEVFLNLSSINSSDMMHCLLWKSHLTEEEMSKMDIITQYYLFNKEVILSNLMFNFKLMLNYVIFKNTFSGIGKIQLSFLVFINCVYDYTNKLQRFSYGIGAMGAYNKNAVLLTLGKKYAPNTDNPGINYGLAFENYSF